jgi:hypothetical protein
MYFILGTYKMMKDTITNLCKQFFSFFIGLLLIGLVGCSGRSTQSPATATGNPQTTPTIRDISSPTAFTRYPLTPTAPSVTELNQSSPTPITTIVPAIPVILLSEDDHLFIDMTNKGYRLISSGSIAGPQDYVYSAYLFFNPDLSPMSGAVDYPVKETQYVAFYRWDGKKNVLLRILPFPTFDNVYPEGVGLINWDEPLTDEMVLPFPFLPDAEAKQFMNGNNFSSDINRNGFPEFAFIVEYCPISCTNPIEGIQLFEFPNSSSVKNITQDLPGLTLFEAHSSDPLTFYVWDREGYDIYEDIETSWIYAWENDKFINVSPSYADEYLAEARSIIETFQTEYGKPFSDGNINTELMALKILKLYEKAGLRDQGLQAFLEVTDGAHWPNTSDLSTCWLQNSRAIAQEDRKQGRPFRLPPSSARWLDNVGLVSEEVKPSRQAGYDVSACQSIEP